MRKILVLILLPISFFVHGQEDYSWWNQAHNWDGVTPWTQYLKYSSKYLGPNGLPVPSNIAGHVGDSSFIEINSAYHYYIGDKTNDIGYNCYYNLVKDLISFQVYGVLLEHYSMDTITRDERASRNRATKGYACGDVNFATIIQLIRDSKFPETALRIAMKTASGQKMTEARYTDGPGYFFDLSFGKTLKFQSEIVEKIRFKGYAGFYCWQTMLTQQRQSDAYMYSIGADVFFLKKLKLYNELSGYYGSLKTGDRPLIVKSTLYYSFKRSGLYFEYYAGLNDYLYKSFRLGIQYIFTH